MIPVVVSQPLISTSSAHYISLALGTIYVGSLYLSKNARLSLSSNRKGRGMGENLRDDPDVIWARMVAVSVATAVCCTIVAAVISQIDPSANVCLQFCLSSLSFLKGLDFRFDQRHSPPSWGSVSHQILCEHICSPRRPNALSWPSLCYIPQSRTSRPTELELGIPCCREIWQCSRATELRCWSHN